MDESSKESSGERQRQEPEAAKLTNEARASETPAGFSASATPANKVVASDEQSTEVQTSGIGGKSTFPVVWSPKLGGDEVSTEQVLHSAADESMHGCSEAPRGDAAASANASTRPLRLVLIAASIATAAAIGSFVGSLSPTGVDRLGLAIWAKAARAHRYPAPAINNESAEISALKASLDAATGGTGSQLAKLSERLDRFERPQAELAAKLARISEALDRLEKKTASAAASPETTGTISSAVPAAGEPKSSDKVLRDWIVREAHNGRALVENRSGGLFEATTGSLVPGLGHVESVKRQDGQWVVITAHGVIYSAP
jgi:hypothetical protein